MGVSNSKLVQVLPPEGNGNGRALVSSVKTNQNGVSQKSAPETNKSNGVLHPVLAKSAHNNEHPGRSFKNVNLQGSMDPKFEIPNQRARIRKSLLDSTANGNLSDVDGDENIDGESGNGHDRNEDNPNESTNNGYDSEVPEVVPVMSSALYDGQLNVKHTEDSSRCDVTGCVVFGGDKIAITDNWNGCVKVFTLRDRSFLSNIQLDMKPWDITDTSPQQLVTTCNTSLIIINVDQETGALIVNRAIEVEGRSRGISYVNETFIVTFVQPEACVKLIQLDGNVLKVIQTHITGARLFKRPEYVAVDTNSGLIYVSDFQTHSVSCLTMAGEPISLYKDEDLKKPTGVAVDNLGNVLVAGWGSENIHKVSGKRCDRLQMVLHSRDIITYPQSLTFYGGTMYISHYHFTSANNYISAYTLNDLQQSMDS